MSETILKNAGRAFVFGDNIDTDVLAPGRLMKLAPMELAKHCLEAIDPSFASTVEAGDFVVGGANFGLGSSREQAAISLRLLGVQAVIAPSFARIFFRNAINAGLAPITLTAPADIQPGDRLAVDLAEGVVENLTQGRRYAAQPLPQHLLDIIQEGGLMQYLKRRGQHEAAQ
jgi:3-isopropylmalate/(R)-2-methylmalate dehydratase small subunit